MPLPRFSRLTQDQQQHVLSVARARFAADGVDGASYNRIIADAGISKTSAYQYFDGRADLLAAVLTDVAERASAVLGPWEDARSSAAFWSKLDEGARRLVDHLVRNPDDRALLNVGVPILDIVGSWFDRIVANAVDLGLIRSDLDPDLLLAATAKSFEAIDGWVLARISDAQGESPKAVDLGDAWRLLARLWGTPALLVPGSPRGRE
jgi:AcrR family transcriptional regulator